MLTRLIVAIISQYIQKSNYYVVHLKLISCYVSIISQEQTNQQDIPGRFPRFSTTILCKQNSMVLICL